MRRRAESADAKTLAFELLDARHHSRPSHHGLIVGVLHRADEHDIVTLKIGNDDVAHRHERRVAAGQRLDRHLPAAQKNQFDVEPVFTKYALRLRHPELGLTRTDRRVTDAHFLHRLRLNTAWQKSLHRSPKEQYKEQFHKALYRFTLSP